MFVEWTDNTCELVHILVCQIWVTVMFGETENQRVTSDL